MTGTTAGRWQAEVDASCTICRASRSTHAYTVKGRHQVVRCTTCGHLYVSPRPSMDDVVSIYGEGYFENPAFETGDHDEYFGYRDYLSDRVNIQRRLTQVLRRIEAYRSPGRLLDIGCGPGLFVDVAAANGWDAWGVDLNESAVAWAQENVSPQVRVGTVTDLGVDDGFFDCISMFDVIEHLADPRAELLEVWRAMQPGGVLVVVTPDAGALVSRALGAHWMEMRRAPEHLQFFTVEGLASLLSETGFTPLAWHSIGKISTVRGLLAEMRFYSNAIFGGIERVLDRVKLADIVLDVDPRTKLCLYAHKTTEPEPLEQWVDRLQPEVPRRPERGLGRPGVRRVRREVP
ncbi:MAG: hypothetical protein QOE63_1217 [Acidimicrobiaceae bacterium]|jgi:2-polyprenyl-3-methyl-5-hydroxy-6-metoxy-1,4-benzoquinol methylase